ncbi:MAG: hypothetical protein VB997_07090 [Opitutales bacterium]
MGIKKNRHSLRGSSPLEIILILMSIGLLIFLALPIYNSFKESGFTSDDPSGEEGNSSGTTTMSSLSPTWNKAADYKDNGSVEVEPVILPPFSEE